MLGDNNIHQYLWSIFNICMTILNMLGDNSVDKCKSTIKTFWAITCFGDNDIYIYIFVSAISA